ncbi:hypothetical protein H0H87_002116 [Tephrocybe sp. NHM501043]|nr:hypothetical protein H0H87_002116 [Tephrocybe sp. NHM501043]
MDSQKLGGESRSPVRGSTRHQVTPSTSESIQPNFTPQTSLPSIRQLHPYLPPSGLSQHVMSSGESSNHMYSAPPQFTPHPSSPGQSILGSRRSSEMFAMESEPDDEEQSRGPPKKKRRRQALSCTGPSLVHLAHAEESNRDVNGTSEKYVTRAEFDDLKARHDELFEQVQRLQAATQVTPYYQMGFPSGLQGTTTGEAVPPLNPHGFQPMISSSPPFNLSTQSQGPQRFIKPEDTQARSRHHQNATATSPALTGSPSSIRPSLSDAKSPTSAVVKASPYSLASITSPFNSQSQPKNCHAQTLVLGQRLRPGSQDLDNPAGRSSEMIQRCLTQCQSQGHRRRSISIIPHLAKFKRVRRLRCNRHLEVSWSHHFKRAPYHATTTGMYYLISFTTADPVSPNLHLTKGQMAWHTSTSA